MKIHKNCCHQSWSFWPRYAPNRLSAAGGFVPHSTRRAYSAPRSPSWFRGWPPGKGKEKREGKGREKEGRGIGRERRRGDERGSWTPQIFRWIDAFALLYFVSDDIMYHARENASVNMSSENVSTHGDVAQVVTRIFTSWYFRRLHLTACYIWIT